MVFAQNLYVGILFYMCLDIHAKFRGDRPLQDQDLKGGGGGGSPPSKNLLSKSPVKIGLLLLHKNI